MEYKIRGVALILLFGLFMIQAGWSAVADEIMNEGTFNITQAAEEIGIKDIVEMPDLNQNLQNPILQTKNQSMISGTGELTEIIEINNTAGESIKGYLIIRGDDETTWQYSIHENNQTGYSNLIASVQASNASFITLSSHAVSSEKHHSLTRIEISKNSLPHNERCSGFIGMFTCVEGKSSYSRGDGINLTGRTDWVCRSYHEVPEDSPAALSPATGSRAERYHNGRAFPLWEGDEMTAYFDDELEISPLDEESPFYDTYASSDGTIINGHLPKITTDTISGPESTQSSQYAIGITGDYTSLWNLGKDWKPGDLFEPGNATICSIVASKNSTVTYYGDASSVPEGKSSSQYNAEATAQSVKYSIQTTPDRRNEHFTLGYLYGGMKSNAGQSRSTGTSIPASFKGSLSGYYDNGTCDVSENIMLSGAYITRNVYGGILEREEWKPVSVVEGNISAGSMQDTFGASRITGVSTFTMQRSDEGRAALKGRLLASAPEKLPITRNMDVITPEQVAYKRSQSRTGLKYIKEDAGFINGIVDLT